MGDAKLVLFFMLIGNLLALLALLAVLWAISVRIKNASIIDIFWGPACAFGAVATYFRADGAAPRDLVLTALVCLWAARLALYLSQRNLGQGEDYRYQAMRRKQASNAAFARWSLTRVFGLQGLIAWFVSLPVQIGQIGGDRSLGALGILGVAVYFFGLGFEAIGDAQLRGFKADPANKDRLMMSGLWAWTRHPNYFGDAAVWTGLTLIALEAPLGWLAVLSPALMAHFLINVSGKALLERGMEKKYPEYAAYRQSTSGFFPLPPRGKPA
jgi:steroid 5-alpha reductase family enzyme